MLTVSDTYRVAVPYSRTFACRVDFYRGSTLVWEQAPVVEGTISADRGQNVRLGCRLTLALAEWEPMPIDEQTCRFKVFLGVSSLGFTETVQLASTGWTSWIGRRWARSRWTGRVWRRTWWTPGSC